METIKINYWKSWFVSLVAMVAVFGIMALHPKYHIVAMLKLQFAKNAASFFAVMANYGYSDVLLRKYIYIDFAFIAAYSLFFMLSLRLVLELAEFKNKEIYLLLCLIPGIFDLIENILMLEMINKGRFGNHRYNFFIAAVIAKWTTVVPMILMSLLVVIFQFLVRVAKIYHLIERQ